MGKDTIIKRFNALLVRDDCVIGARGYDICRYDLETGTLERYAGVDDWRNALLARFSLSKRYFWADVSHLYALKDGSELVIAKSGIFRRDKGSETFEISYKSPTSYCPLNLCVDPATGYIYFGEYFSNFEKKPVQIYRSRDNGCSWEVVYIFEEGNINHVHGVFFDKYTSRLWVTTGDRENECIIGYTEDGFESFHELFRGGQEYRCCVLMFFEDRVMYVTDSQYMRNSIMVFDRQNPEIRSVYNISGSGIFGGQSGDMAFCSSSVEPSDVNTERYSHVYVSLNRGENWLDIAKYEKDFLPKSAFQFGSILFPRYERAVDDLIVYTGRSVKGIGGHTVIRGLETGG
jgi:hypothetical protein